MSIQKKSLIGNLTAAKKAIVATQDGSPAVGRPSAPLTVVGKSVVGKSVVGR